MTKMRKEIKQKDREMVAYRIGMRDTLEFLAEEYALDYGMIAWLFEEWILNKYRKELKHYEDFCGKESNPIKK